MIFRRHPIRKLAAIYAGGVCGALLRVSLGEAFPHGAETWPWPTFAANLQTMFAGREEEYRARLDSFPELREAVVEDSGHMLHHDQPQRLATLLEEFLG